MRPAIKRVLAIWATGIAVTAMAAAETKLIDRPARTSSRDIKIPRALVRHIEEDYRAFLVKNEVSPKVTIQRQLLNLSVELTQKSAVALHDNTRIVTPLGGGVIDLSEFITPLRGAFWLKIVARKEKDADAEPQGLRVFYVSKGKTRILDGEEYGAGCNRYMEITSFYNKKSAGGGKGFELYTANQRYLSVIGGTIVAIAFEKETLSVGTLTFTDSRYPDLLCD